MIYFLSLYLSYATACYIKLLPYRGDKGCNIIKSINKCVHKLLPNNTKIEVVFKSTKLSSCFNKDNHDLIYHAKWSEPTCIDDYVGESAHWITEKIKDPNGRDHTSQVWNHSIEKSHRMSTPQTLKLLIRIFIIINENGKLPKRCGSKI